MTIYPKALIARIKGALAAGLKPKQIAYLTGIPDDTIKSWATRGLRASIEADPSVIDEIRLAILKDLS